MRALRHPALGLVLVVLGLAGLPQQMFGIVTLVSGGDGLPPEILAMYLAQFAIGSLQVGTGWAIIRGRAPTAWFSAYLAACVVQTVLMTQLMRGEDSELKLLLGIGLETLGLPAIIVIASALYRSESFADDRSPADVIAILLVIAVRTLTMTPLDVVQNLRLMGMATTTGSYAGMLVWPALSVGLGILALVAVRRFARRSLGVYVVAAIGVHVAMALVSVVWTLAERNDGGGPSLRWQLIAHQFLGLITILGGPLTLWWYPQEQLASPEPAAPRAPSRVPIWLALSYVPMLLARAFLADEMTALWGDRSAALVIAIAGTVAMLLLVTADAAFRRRPSARWWTLLAAVGGVSIVAGACVVIFAADNRFGTIGLFGPLGNLVASTTVAAWLYRGCNQVGRNE